MHAASRYARSLLEASLDPLVTISPGGKITDVNLATELVTGVAREQLIGSRFRPISPSRKRPRPVSESPRRRRGAGLSADHSAPSGPHHRCAVQRDGLPQRGRRSAGRVCRGAGHHRAQANGAAREFTNALLALFAQKATANEYLVLGRGHPPMDRLPGLGVRLSRSRKYPTRPAAVSSRVLDLEPALVRHDSCLCTRAITRSLRGVRRQPADTRGLFPLRRRLAFLKGVAPEKQASYRGNCMKFGFASLAIVPIRYRRKWSGSSTWPTAGPANFRGRWSSSSNQ